MSTEVNEKIDISPKKFEERRSYMRERLPIGPTRAKLKEINKYISIEKMSQITGILPSTLRGINYAKQHQVRRKNQIILFELHTALMVMFDQVKDVADRVNFYD